MATVKQYEFFKALYDEENGRYGLLEARAKLYTTILSFYLGALAFKLKDAKEFFDQFGVPLLIAVLAGLTFVLALLCCVIAVLIRKYEGVANPEEVIEGLPDEPMSDEEFFDARIADFAVATNLNSIQNDKAAIALLIAGWLIVVGVVLHVIVFTFALLK